MNLTARRVDISDAELLWRWANEAEVRGSSTSPDPIPWESHVRWLEKKLGDPNCSMLLLQEGPAAVAVVRFDREGKHATISISVDRLRRGKGIGAEALRLAAREAEAQWPVEEFHAYVKPENSASLSLFERAGYRRVRMAELHGVPVWLFVKALERSVAG